MTTSSPFDEFEAPEQLVARVVTPEPRPRLHGFDVQEDLVRHYDFAEIVFTSLVGRPPLRHEGRGFNILLGFLLPISVAEAPAHGAVIARICGAQTQRVVAAGAVVLCEQARQQLDRRAALLDWIDHGRQGPPPAGHEPIDPREQEAVVALHERLREAGMVVSPAEALLSLYEAIIAGLYACGLTHGWQIEAVWCLARLPAATAEAMSYAPGAFNEYPVRQPPFEYRAEKAP